MVLWPALASLITGDRDVRFVVEQFFLRSVKVEFENATLHFVVQNVLAYSEVWRKQSFLIRGFLPDMFLSTNPGRLPIYFLYLEHCKGLPRHAGLEGLRLLCSVVQTAAETFITVVRADRARRERKDSRHETCQHFVRIDLYRGKLFNLWRILVFPKNAIFA